jgi:hypothetical protein
VPLFEYFATSVCLLTDMCASIFFSATCNILESTVGQRDIQVFKLSTISCTFYSECYSIWYHLESHSSPSYKGLTPTPYPTKFGSGNQMYRIFVNHKTPLLLTMHMKILTRPRYEET